MSAFRNIIARRRPPGSDEPVVEQGDPPAVGRAESAATGTRLTSFTDRLEPTDATKLPQHPRPRSRPASCDEIPRWELEPPRRTMGEGSLGRDVPEDDPLSALPDPVDAAPGRKIWDLESPSDDPQAEPAAEQAALDAAPATTNGAGTAAPPVAAPGITADLIRPAPGPAPAPAPAPARTQRVKTRLLGFHTDDIVPDVFAPEKGAASAEMVKCPVGFVVIVDGPGFGTAFALSAGLSTLGRGEDQTIALDFGDDSISRNNHASIAYDEEENKVLIGHGGKSNLVRLNGKPLVSTTELSDGDQVRIGRTTLRFVAVCGAGFSWAGARQGAEHDE